jgi:hypothetical protein
MRLTRLFFTYCVLSLVLFPLNLLMGWPELPKSALGWIALIFLPIPLEIAGEWLFKYREFRYLRSMDKLGERIDQSKYRLAIMVTIMILVCGFFYGVSFLNAHWER